MRILWVATKPPWPPIDGGRLLVDGTLRALAAAGARLTLVVPDGGVDRPAVEAALDGVCELHWVAARRRSVAAAVFAGLSQRLPLSVARHALPAVRAAVDQLCRERRFEVLHAEQLQAFWATSGTAGSLLPRVLRAQNVESDLWLQAASRKALLAPVMAWEGRRLAAWEGASVAAADLTLALTGEDSQRLAKLAGGGRLEVLAAPFAERLPAAERVLPGAPAIVLLGSAGWLPNRLAGEHFVRTVWPRLRQRLPRAELHVFGDLPLAGGAPALHLHPPLVDSRQAFAPGSILVVPLRIASGVRMKILEAWARGVPVVASPAAARGLRVEGGRELLLAEATDDYLSAIERLAAQEDLRSVLVRAGRQRLRADHRPADLAARQLELYESLAASKSS